MPLEPLLGYPPTVSTEPFRLRSWLETRAARCRRIAQQTITVAGIAGLVSACSGPSLVTASGEPGCARCSVLAESSTPFVELQSHDDSLFLLDAREAIWALSKATAELANRVPPFSGAAHFGVSAAWLAWVAPSDVSGTQTQHIHALGRDASAAPPFADFQGEPELAVGLGDVFVGAYSGDRSGSQVIRYGLADGSMTFPTETLSDEETGQLPRLAGGDAEVVWCRTHADSSSSLWRLGATGDATKTDYPFSCAELWTTGDGQIFVLDRASGMNCYYRIDSTGQSQQLLCASERYEHFTPLADGSVAVVDAASAAVRRVTTDGQVSLLFEASYLVGLQSDGDQLFYATANHVGSFAWRSTR